MDLPWFKFSPASWMIGRISRQSPEVQVAFLRLCCVYWNEGCDLTFERAGLEVDEILGKLIKIRMVERSEDRIFIKFLDDQFEEFKGKRSKQSMAGKASAEKRKPIKRRPKIQAEDPGSKDPGIAFAEFYDRYPRKIAKASAEKIWFKLSAEDQSLAIAGITRMEPAEQKFIPYPSTYLNQRRWEDLPKETSHDRTDRNEY